MRDCRRIYFATRALVFWHRRFVKRQEFRRSAKRRKPHLSVDRGDAFQTPREAKCFSRNRPCRKEIILTALTKTTDEQWMLFLLSISLFFHRDRHGVLRDSTAAKQTRVKGLKRGFTRRFWTFSADLPRSAAKLLRNAKRPHCSLVWNPVYC